MSRRNKCPRVLLCGPRIQGNVTGLTLAFELLVEGMRQNNINYQVVDATFLGKPDKSGQFSLARAIETLIVVARVWLGMLRCDVYYTTMSTSSVGFWRDYLTVASALLLRRRIVLHLHGGGFQEFYCGRGKWMQHRIKNMLSSVTDIIVLGELLKKQFECVGPSVMNKLRVVPNGLTYGVKEPSIQSKRYPDDDEEIHLLYMSSMIPSKGFLDVINAVGMLAGKLNGRPWKLHLCGAFVSVITEGDCPVRDEASLEKYLSDKKLDKQVIYHKLVVGPEKNEQLMRAHIFLLPTVFPWEGQPLSIIEALAYATPVISTYHKGIPEQVTDGLSGKLVRPACPEDIASSIECILSDEAVYTKYSRAARTHYEHNFRREVHVRRMLEIILH